MTELRSLDVTPHVTAKHKGSAIDGRTTGQVGYRVSQVIRKRIEKAFEWMKASAGLRETHHRGLGRLGWQFALRLWRCR